MKARRKKKGGVMADLREGMAHHAGQLYGLLKNFGCFGFLMAAAWVALAAIGWIEWSTWWKGSLALIALMLLNALQSLDDRLEMIHDLLVDQRRGIS